MALGMCRAVAQMTAHRTLFSHTPRLIRPMLHCMLSKRSMSSTQSTHNQPGSLDKVRNIGIIAHIDAGKTTTTERMLHYAGFTRSIGDVDDGDTVMDFLPAERERGITIQSAAITFGWRDHQLHLIDTPGHVDFTVEVERAMRVLDGAVTILDAVAGVQAQTKTVWKQATRYSIPRVIFINKMDRDGANWRRCVRDIETKLGARPLVLQVPESTQARLEGSGLESWIDAVTMERITFDIAHDNTGSTVRREVISQEDGVAADAYEAAADARVQLVEALAEIDQRIVDVFLGDEVDGDHLKVPAEEIRAAVRRSTLSSQACPVLLGASFRNVGVQPLLDSIIDYLPAPTDLPAPMALAPAREHHKAIAHQPSGSGQSTAVQVHPNPNDKLVAFAFKVIVDPQRGPMVFVRVYSGSLDSRMTLVNGTRGGVKERATKLLQMYADLPEEIQAIQCGHIGVVLGLKQTKTGDTLLHPQHPSLAKLGKGGKASSKKQKSAVQAAVDTTSDVAAVGWQLHGISVPPPVFFCAVEADSPQDERPLAEALANLILEDPSLHLSHDEETGQTLLSGMGELHLEVIRDRLLNDLKINASFGKMRVSYREMAGQQASADFTYAREIAGKAGKAALRVTVSPIEEAFAEDADSAERPSDGNIVEIDMPDTLMLADISGSEAAAAGGSREENAELSDQVRTAIHEGIRNASFRGCILGFPVTRSRIQVSDIKYFGEELSTAAAYRACAGQALAQALSGCSPVLLEPIARTAIQCPESHVGSVLSDLNGMRKGRVLSLDDADEDGMDSTNATKIVLAEVPLSTMVGYSSSLRSLTAGSGTFTMEVTGFGPMTAQQQQQVIKESRGY
ncbi:P-loop containing nucleoside triphosphate hydrolase protein [Martensiomyces pterosporus]|nr:P-loop containing nucleoside triphosphate hydrolase protein [Martensiomyces pterosporus]